MSSKELGYIETFLSNQNDNILRQFQWICLFHAATAVKKFKIIQYIVTCVTIIFVQTSVI
jgi:hypothetical protein